MNRLFFVALVVLASACGRTELFDRGLLDTEGGPDFGTAEDVGVTEDVGVADVGLDMTQGDGKLGDPCETGADCESGLCRDFGGDPICTVPCDSQCPVERFVCFESVCTPDDYCSPDGQGPGCIVSCEQCDINAICDEDAAGGLTCTCGPGYAGNGLSCDVNECVMQPCSEDATCTDLVPGFVCECNPGWRGDGLVCDDVDECAEFIDNCSINAVCVNVPGSFACDCLPGFEGNGQSCRDINECLQNPCNGGTCTNLMGGYTCECPMGSMFDGATCVGGIDLCATGMNNCDSNATCTLANNPDGYACACNAGFTGDGFTCTPVGTCNPACGPRQVCDSTNTCVCEPGFVLSGGVCMDVNECTAGTDTCDVNATCTNTLGGFSCACNSGFVGNGVTCADVDECADPTTCGPLQTCTNTAGGFSCACAPGTFPVGNDCVLQGDVCQAPFAVNSTPFSGSNNTTGYGSDYRFQGGQCPGVNGGRGNNTADQVWAFTPTTTGVYQVQINAQGWFGVAYVVTDCAQIGNTCLAADTGDPDFSVSLTANTTYYIIVDGNQGFTGPYTIDVSLNECASGTDNCDPNATCIDTLTGFTCACPDGFTGNGTTCTDIDECTNGSDNCDVNATCTNTPGGFECACNAGFTGDGVTCYDGSAPGESCTNPFVIGALPYTFSGDTSDAQNDYDAPLGSCPGLIGGGGASNDEVFTFTPTVNGTYRFEVTSSWQSIVYVRTACTSNAACLGGGSKGFNPAATVDATLLANVTYFIVVDGVGQFTNVNGAYTLNVTKL